MPTNLTCPKCGKDYTLKTLAPGSKGRCSKCKAVIEVPETLAPENVTMDAYPDETIDGAGFAEEGCLSVAGLSGGVELEDSTDGGSKISELLSSSGTKSRYVIDKEIARGGM
ncbi:MAG: zinc ribbon domain-containing protein, partial [Planctomycetota bacterium]